ncbi:hypothetical protein CH370_09640 [Leptospira kmetyi]|nr:hypothetical protein CH370_09640 [Leptospira kmetyi]
MIRQIRRLTIGSDAALRDAFAPSLGLRHISLCHSPCRASLAPSPCGLAKRRQALVVRRQFLNILLK